MESLRRSSVEPDSPTRRSGGPGRSKFGPTCPRRAGEERTRRTKIDTKNTSTTCCYLFDFSPPPSTPIHCSQTPSSPLLRPCLCVLVTRRRLNNHNYHTALSRTQRKKLVSKAHLQLPTRERLQSFEFSTSLPESSSGPRRPNVRPCPESSCESVICESVISKA